MSRYKIVCGDFREHSCPSDAALVLVDPPYGIGKAYAGQTDKRPFEAWVNEILEWSNAPRTMIFGPHKTLRDWLPQVPAPYRIIWWHRTFTLPRRGLRSWTDAMTPILLYQNESAPWYGPTRADRTAHDCIDAHCSLADIPSLRKARGDKVYPKHPAITGTQITKKILPFVMAPDDLVVDPMCGVGPILAAAVRLRGRAWGCELNSEWAELAGRWCAYEEGRSNKK